MSQTLIDIFHLSYSNWWVMHQLICDESDQRACNDYFYFICDDSMPRCMTRQVMARQCSFNDAGIRADVVQPAHVADDVPYAGFCHCARPHQPALPFWPF